VADWPLTSDLGPLGALPTVPRLARGFISVTLRAWGLDDLTDVTELLVSELSTNVVRAATDPEGAPRYDDDGKLPLLWIRLLFDHDRLMVEVWDTLPAALGAPVARHPEADEESGRGLEIIETLAEDWGWESVPGWSGKKVWATLKVVVLLPGAHMLPGGQPPDPAGRPLIPGGQPLIPASHRPGVHCVRSGHREGKGAP
jgi:anti-sigma regulatory factor (Ser/Thr protein kinase)